MDQHSDDSALLLMFLAFLAGGLLALEFGAAWFVAGGVLALLIGVASVVRKSA